MAIGAGYWMFSMAQMAGKMVVMVGGMMTLMMLQVQEEEAQETERKHSSTSTMARHARLVMAEQLYE